MNRKAAVLLASCVLLSLQPGFAASRHKAIQAKENQAKIKGEISEEVKLGDDAMLKGKYDAAADYYHQAINKDSKDAQAYAGYGNALAKQFKLDAAEEQLNKALELDANNAGAYSAKAMLLLNRLQSSSASVIKNRESVLSEAANDAKQAINIDSNLPEAHYNLGMVLKEQGQLDQAAGEFVQASQLDPKYADAFTGLGLIRLAQNSYAEAEASFKQAISLNSGNSTAHYGLGATFLKEGMVDNAIKELNTSLYQFPNSAPVHQQLGEAYEAQGNIVASLNEYQKAIGIKPETPSAYIKIANIREGRGDTEMAIAELRSGVELMPNNPDLHMQIANDSLGLQKLDEAVREYQSVLNFEPGNAPAIQGLTRAYYLKAQKETTGAFMTSNDFEKAEQEIQQAIQLNPNDMTLRLAQAKMAALSGKPIDLASIGTPHNDGERVAYAEALLAQNKFAEAGQQMNMVIGNANKASQAFAVADLALMIRDLDSAQAAYQKASTFNGASERAQRGLAMVDKARQATKVDLNLANDLAKRKQFASAIDKFHAAIYDDPKSAQARLGLADALEKEPKPQSKDLREAVTQLQAYLTLTPNMPDKVHDKFSKRIEKLQDKAYKLAQKEQRTS
jgi:tetratricopeptide (TPR) repeat protein